MKVLNNARRIRRTIDKKIVFPLIPSNKPDFLIIGSQKCGTSSLHYYLDQHPNFSAGIKHKEVAYFNSEIYFKKNYKWYENNFKCYSKRNVRFFESTPGYIYQPNTASKIFDYDSNMKMILLLRDPVKRAYSAWNHYKDIFESKRQETALLKYYLQEGNFLYDSLYKDRTTFPSFRECIDIELSQIESGVGFEPSILRRGLYLEQLQKFWLYFERTQIKVIGFKDLINNTKNVLNDICDFLSVEKSNWGFLVNKPYNSRRYFEEISEKDKTFLTNFYKRPNESLFNEIDEVHW